MIKINLLRDPFVQSPAKAGGKNENTGQVQMTPEPTSSGDKPSSVLAIVFGLIFSSVGGLYYWRLDSNFAEEEERNAILSEEKQKLEPYFLLEKQFREQKESLTKKEEVLTKLKKQQQLPVYFLQELGNSVPENVWFVKITSKGPKIEIRGESLTEDAIYQFRDNLVSKSQWFRNVNFANASRKDKKLEFTLTFDLANMA
jgi:Tfp pilus assembly protein PilN